MGNTDYPWSIQASINSSSSLNVNLILQTQVNVVNGYANFTTLGVSSVVSKLVISYNFVPTVGVNS